MTDPSPYGKPNDFLCPPEIAAGIKCYDNSDRKDIRTYPPGKIFWSDWQPTLNPIFGSIETVSLRDAFDTVQVRFLTPVMVKYAGDETYSGPYYGYLSRLLKPGYPGIREYFWIDKEF